MIYISTAVGGGARGKDAGTVQDTMITAGLIIVLPHPFIEQYPQAGEMITEIIAGKDIHGITNEYLTSSFDLTGRDGKTTDIGKEIIPGMFRDYRRGNIRVRYTPRGNLRETLNIPRVRHIPNRFKNWGNTEGKVKIIIVAASSSGFIFRKIKARGYFSLTTREQKMEKEKGISKLVLPIDVQTSTKTSTCAIDYAVI